jgi:GT2 family glycosyltransferase
MTTKPRVSIIILNYNGKKWLAQCLPTWRKVTYPDVEVVVVNNGSSDDSAAFVKANFPEVRLLDITPNRGFAGGNNYGVREATGKYVMLLNNDTTVSPGLLEPVVELMERNPGIGVVQPEMRSMIHPDRHDAVASYYTSTGFLYHYGYMQPIDKSQYRKALFAYTIKGSGMIMRRDDYLELGGLDEDFVCYVEESDLCHRVWLSGKKVVYYPKSLMHHYGGGDMSIMEKGETTIFRSFRNRYVSYIKNLGFAELVKVLAVHTVFAQGYVVTFLLRGRVRQALAAYWGIFWWLFHLPSVLKKRRHVQSKIRKVSDADLMRYFKKDPPFSYFMHFLSTPLNPYDEAEISESPL